MGSCYQQAMRFSVARWMIVNEAGWLDARAAQAKVSSRGIGIGDRHRQRFYLSIDTFVVLMTLTGTGADFAPAALVTALPALAACPRSRSNVQPAPFQPSFFISSACSSSSTLQHFRRSSAGDYFSQTNFPKAAFFLAALTRLLQPDIDVHPRFLSARH